MVPATCLGLTGLVCTKVPALRRGS